ncbi:MAG: hypothetical protein HY925_04555 [Elusimicrobia bacterium]|nr:hypothetical protein [Elusimicrobiota bacterium]
MNRHLCLVACLLLGAAQFSFADKRPQRKAVAAPAPSPVEEPSEDATGEEEPASEPDEAASDDSAAPEESLLEQASPAPERPNKRATMPPPPRPALQAPAPAVQGAAEPSKEAPKPAEEPLKRASERGYDWLEKVAGPDVVKLLASQGYIVTYKLDKTLNLAHVQWEMLEPLVKRAPALLEAQAAIGGFRQGRQPDGKEKALKAVLELPSTGLATPRIRSAASVLLDLLEERRIAGSMPLPQRPFASQAWSRDFVKRYNVREVRDPSPIADPYFLEVLCAPASAAPAPAHLAAEEKNRYGNDIADLVARDTKSGQLSDDLRGWVMKYLDDNRHALRLAELPADFATLFQSNQLQRELADLRAASDALSKDPAFLDVLRSALAPGREPADTVKVTFGALHVHAPTHGDAYDPGDKAEISGAYWLDGLTKGESTQVEELVFVDRGAEGVEILSDHRRSLGAGGPYTFSVNPAVQDGRPFVVRVVLHAAGAAPAHRDENVAPSSDMDKTLVSLGRADRQLTACKLKDAAAAYDSLSKDVAGKKGRAPFERLAADLRPRVKRTQLALEDFEELQGLLEPLRRDASTRECAFATDRGERARGLLRRLPAGCSRDLAPEVNQLLAAAAQRQRDQETFWEAVRRARKLEQNCKHQLAAERYAAGLAVLDADSAAKCGAAEAEYKLVQTRELPAALAAEAIQADFDRQIQEASGALEKSEHAKALGTLNPLLARIGASPAASCYEIQRKRAEELADRGGAELKAGPMALARVPDSTDGPIAAVTKERDRMRAEEEAKRKRELAQQAPAALEELPGVPASAPEVESGEAPKQAQSKPATKAPAPKAQAAREEALRASRKAAEEAEAAVEEDEDAAAEALLASEKTEVRAKPATKAKPEKRSTSKKRRNR